MNYYEVVVNVPLYTTFTYSHTALLVRGQRVVVPFRGKKVVALVWQENQQPTVATEKIKAIAHVFDEAKALNASWCALVDFCARYYHYPVGQTAFAALAKGLRQPKVLNLKPPERAYCLNEEGQQQPDPPASHRQKHTLWQQLKTQNCTLSQLRVACPQAKKYLDHWLTQGWLSSSEASSLQKTASAFILNPEQQTAVDAINTKTGQFAPFLLFGITGSGKTEVYFSCMERVLQRGGQVLFLLPEISLTPQLLDRVRQRFSAYRSTILHSQIADGERTQGYMDAASGDKQLIIGTRLSVFTPMHKLGLIVVDEEHDASFKQDDELRYHARDLALWRANTERCPIILGSATPSLESFHKARQGKYQLLTLTERANKVAVLPEIQLEDVRRQRLEDGFSARAIELLKKNFVKGNLSLVYLNRRGFAPALVCTACGYSFGCPHCSAKMVLHKTTHSVSSLRCHHCNFSQSIPVICPSCGNQDLSALGQGTQRVEETLMQMLPGAKIARVDRDSTSHKKDWERLYQQINQNEVNVLVGTQMLAKGHDFAHLSLVIILNADGSLYSPDFRSSERLFSELMQVSGRAGRAEKKGRVLLQTQLPEHELFMALQQHSYPDFAREELEKRQLFGFSPMSHSIAIRADALSVGEALHFLTQVKNALTPSAEVGILGPAPAFMVRLAKRERAQLFLESTHRKILHQTVQSMLPVLQAKSKQYKQLRWSIDVDPMAV